MVCKMWCRCSLGGWRYWPSLGLGALTHAIRNSPRLRDALRQPQSVLLADLNGRWLRRSRSLHARRHRDFYQPKRDAVCGCDFDPRAAAISGTVRAANMQGKWAVGW